MNKSEQESTKALFESGEVEKYTKEYFRTHGRRGREILNKKYSKKERSAIAKKAWETKRKLSTED